jgi:RHS repeat-associated protein
MKTLSRNAVVWIAIGCVVLGAPSAGGADPPAPATVPTPGGDAWDGDSVDLSTGIFVHRKTDLYVDGAIPIALTRTYRSGDSGARPFGIGSSHPYQIFLSATAPYQEASLILADGSAIRYVRTSPGTDVLGAVFEHVGTPTAFYGSTLTGAAAWMLATTDGVVYQLGANVPLQRIDDYFARVVEVLRDGAAQTGVVTRVVSPTQIISPNDRWIIFAYDALNRIVQTRDTLGRIIAYSYDAAGCLASVTDAEGGITRYTYDGQHRMLTIRDPRGTVSLTNEYDAAGRVIRQALADLTEYRFAYSLDPSGKVVRTDVTDPRGVVRRVTFDARGYRVSDTRALGAPIEQTTTYERAVSGFVLSVTDPLGRRTAFTRDTKGLITSVTRLAGSAQAATTSLSYAPTGRGGVRRIASITDPLGQVTSFAYDSVGYPAQVTDPLGGRTSVAGLGGMLWGLTDGLDNGTELRRDNAVDVAAATDPLGRVTALGHDGGGRLVSRTNPLGQRVGYAYDRLDRLVQITDPAGGTTRLQHDANGNLVTITDARSKATRFVYDGMNRLVSRIDPLQVAESFTYDGNGNVTSATDRKGQVTVVSYDVLDRPVTVSYADGSTVSYVWDAGNRLVQIVDSLAGTITRAWDLHDRLNSETTALGTVAYSYDAAGRRIAMSVPGQPAVGYGYDAAGRLTQVSRGALSVSAVYDAAGRRTSLILPNGVTAEYAYDAASQLVGLTYRHGPGVLGTLTYAYDAAGNRVRAGGTWARVGLPQPVASVTHDDANRVLTFGGAALTHDANGNLTSDGARTYTWNARNQLVAVDGAGISMRFGYDALGRRQEQQADTLVTRFLYDGVHAVEVFGSAGEVSLLGGLDVVEHLALGEPGDGFVPLTDALGSVLALSDEAGAVGAEYTYQPFGATAGPAGPDPNPYRFTGREVDDTGLHFHRARYYHPALQRFIAENPIGFAGARANLYAYAQNNPLSLTDPLGADVDPAGQQSIAATAMAAWDPVGGRAAPESGLHIAGLVDADAALLERVIGAWASPEQARALDALRPITGVERGNCTPLGARVDRSWTVEQVAANLLKLPAGAPHRCARH